MTNWKHGNIKEVARILHSYGNNNITYDTTPNSVVFYSDGFFVASYNYFLNK